MATGISIGFGLILGVVLFVVVCKLLAFLLRVLAGAFLVWEGKHSGRVCGVESHTDKCILPDNHRGPHRSAPRQRDDGSWYHVSFTGSRWAGATCSWGESCEAPK